jgi:hypothetical protein
LLSVPYYRELNYLTDKNFESMTPENELPTEGSFGFPMDNGLGNGALISPYLGSRALGLFNFIEVKDKPLVNMGGSTSIQLSIKNNNYFLNATIHDLDDNLVLEIDDNKWRVFKKAAGKYNFDKNGFELFDNTDRIVLSFDFRKDSQNNNITTLFIQGFTLNPDGSVGFYPSSGFFDPLKLEDPSHTAMRQFVDKTPIQPLFRYSGNHWENARLAAASIGVKLGPPGAQSADTSSTTTATTTSNTDSATSNADPAPPSPSSADPGYWFLKLNPSTWDILGFEEDFKNNTEALFGTHTLDNERRVDYDSFFEINKGDKIIGYAFGTNRTIECVFEVTQEVHLSQEAGEVISMRIERRIIPSLPLEFFAAQLTFRDQLEGEHPQRLFRLSKEIFDSILSSDSETFITAEQSITHLTTEGDHRSTDDQLSFANDIASFGTVMCLKTVNPPLAIGLFGNWGSGKSFFMEKLADYIDSPAITKDDRFLHHIVQVKFNSWHYSDANLWASLITEIFDSLSAYASKTKQYGEIEKLSATLQLTSIHKEEISKKKKELQEKVLTLRREQLEKRKRLEDISGLKLLTLAFLDPKIREDIRQLNNEGIDAIKNNVGKLEGYVAELNSFRGQVRLFVTQLITVKGRKWWLLIGLAIAVFVITWLIKNHFSFQWQQVSWWSSIKVGLAVSLAGKITQAVVSYKGLFNKINDRWKSLKKTLDERPEAPNEQLDDHERELLKLTGSLQDIEQKIIQTKKQISDISSGRKLLEFIDTKSRDESYAKQLGLIASIRKDFQTLDRLLREQHQVMNKDIPPIENPEGVQLEIDRIILYIDDLDRCNEDIVVKVLEAIHLLLAFPLFVVVVGVDPRWLNNALNSKYSNLFKSITSFDYLEKIFQTPFTLKEVTSDDRKKFLQYLMKDEMEKSAIPAPGPTSAPNPTTTPPPRLTDPVPGTGYAPPQHGPQPIGPNAREEQARVLDNVSFKPGEIDYLNSISEMFGQTPRMMNRYVNIYRIIKSHKSYRIAQTSSPRDYKSTMFVLAIIIGCPENAKNFVQLLKATPEENMIKFIETMEDLPLKHFIADYSDKTAVDNLSTAMVKRNIDLISRFSFRTYTSQAPPTPSPVPTT